MPEVKIRHARQEDHGPLCRFIEIVDNDFYPPLSMRGNGIEQRVWECLAGKHSYYLIAEGHSAPHDTAGNIIGVIGCSKFWRKENDAYINLMCVHPLQRKKGISRALYQELERDLMNEGIRKLYVCTWSTNDAAMRFYGSNGFIPYCIVKNDRGNRVDTIHYRKTFQS
ncbi:MAG: putative acetyltransferase [Methanomethylovorans sp. PtaU1.Bin093]|jgi:ribosomal protein S18 acetylase RimI-like enzyme|uniref:GNAT family N-acetyltransferase n=1 Tax=Methanomethylovorans sp. PtaU1.Bin093 TaxID=1811679 RepID=UPI0009CF99C8|nr:GNAT family N-acetyltransferase [Methanomethylovorans sp. PtaU1.Bin093]OPY18683.1 MAG: putative acetyltransferase [Methanomethylovorans sp. PtaU1.Bin093]